MGLELMKELTDYMKAGHPTYEQLEKLGTPEGRAEFTSENLAHMDGHLASCSDCKDRFDLSQDDELPLELPPLPLPPEANTKD